MYSKSLVLVGVLALLTVMMATTDRAPSAASSGPLAGGVALVDQTTGMWHLHVPDRPGASFYYGNPGDEPFFGDWDCDGEATPGLYRRSDGYVYLRNANTAGTAHVSFYFGDPGDFPLAGDFDGDGCDTVSIFRPGESRVYVTNRLAEGDRGLGAADYSFPFGDPGDVAFAGDFDGDGVDTVAGFRPGSNLVFLAADPYGTSIDEPFHFGDHGDRPLAAPTLAGRDTVALYRPAERRLIFRDGAGSMPLPGAEPDWTPVAGALRAHAAATASSPPASNSPTDATVYPGESIQAAASAQPPGATIVITRGEHRLQQVVPKSGQTFVGEPGAVLNGSRLLTSFTYEGGWWVASGQTQQGLRLGRCAAFEGAYYDGCRYPEDVFYDDRPLWQVTDPAQLAPGRWLFDYDNDRILLADDPSGRKVEVSVAKHAFSYWRAGQSWDTAIPGNVTIRGLVIEKYASPPQHGAIQAGGYGSGDPPDGMSQNWLIEGNELRWNHGAGIRVGDGTLVRDNYIHHNGQSGLASDSTGAIVEGNEIAFNNTMGFDITHGSGGFKFGKTRNLTITGNYVHHNHGPGLWADTDNVGTRYLHNRVEDNSGPGIFHEVSYDAEVAYNEVHRNGYATPDWSYGAGILIAHSPGVEVHHNRLSGNADGIVGIDQNPGTGAFGPYVLDRLWVHDNYVEITDGWVGVTQDHGDPSVFQRDIRFERNRYRTGGRSHPFAWNDREASPADWLGAGHDLDGSITS